MRVRNISKATRVFPSGVALDPGESADVDDADFEHPVISAWIDEGHISEDNGAEEGEGNEGGEKKPAPKSKRAAKAE